MNYCFSLLMEQKMGNILKLLKFGDIDNYSNYINIP
jgi:hypothetical protein